MDQCPQTVGTQFALSYIDIDHYIIPDSIIIFGIICAFLLALIFPDSHLVSELTKKPVLDWEAGLIEQLYAETKSSPRLLALIDWLSGAFLGFAIFSTRAFITNFSVSAFRFVTPFPVVPLCLVASFSVSTFGFIASIALIALCECRVRGKYNCGCAASAENKRKSSKGSDEEQCLLGGI